MSQPTEHLAGAVHQRAQRPCDPHISCTPASPTDPAEPLGAPNTLTTALKPFLAQTHTHTSLSSRSAASQRAGRAQGSNNHGHTYTVSNTCFHGESLNKLDSTCPPGAHCSPTSPTSLRLSHTLHPLASPVDTAAPHRRSQHTDHCAQAVICPTPTHTSPASCSLTIDRYASGRGLANLIHRYTHQVAGLLTQEEDGYPPRPC